MPHVTEHTPKVSIRSLNSYARESSREKRQHHGRTDGQIHRRIVQNHFSRRFEDCTSQVRSYLEVDSLHDANTFIDVEVKEKKLGIITGNSQCLTEMEEKPAYSRVHN